MTNASPSPFCASLPAHQFAWDQTSLTTLMTCPRKYYYSIVQGRRSRGTAAPLAFGGAFHVGVETYDKARAEGYSHDLAQIAAVRKALASCIIYEDEIIHKEEGLIGSKIVFKGYALGDDSKRTPESLIRSIIWYTENYKDDVLQTLRLPDGRPAVELSFRIALDSLGPNPDNEPYLWCGHIDKIAEWDGVAYIVEHKTTAASFGPWYEAQFTGPNTQVTGYIFAGQVILGQPVVGAVIDAAGLMAHGTRFQRYMATRTPESISEFVTNIDEWIRLSRLYALRGFWPKNETACTAKGMCPYIEVCSASPSMQQRLLEANYTEQRWNPLENRGDE